MEPNSVDFPPRLLLAIPDGVNHHAVATRKALLLAASEGLNELIAERFALEAEQSQAWHDNRNSRHGAQATAMTEAEEIAATILAAKRSDSDANPAPQTNAPENRAAVA